MRVFRRGVPAVLVILLSVLFLKGSTITVPAGTWQSTANMSAARANAVAVLVPDGRIVVAGGTDSTGTPTASAEAFSADGSFAALPAMSAARSQHAAIYTMTGDLLLTGGYTSGGGITNSAEIFDSLTNTWHSLSATMLDARAGHTMSQLQNGNVLIAGGESSSGPVAALEIYDISSGQFSFAGTLATARKGHAAAVLNDGRILIVGGTTVQSDGTSATLASAEIYDPTTGQVIAGPSLATPRTNATATTLLDGRVLVVGGSYREGANGAAPELASAEIYDPVSNTFTASASQLATARAGHLAFLLPNNNNVLIAGGTATQPDGTVSPLASAELYTPWTDTFAATSPMSTARAAASGSALGNGTYIGLDGMLLLAGGTNQNSAEVYGFATVKTDAQEYVPGVPVLITGSGWIPGETVQLGLVESPAVDSHAPLTAVADANGNIYNNQFSPDTNDAGITFFLTAKGSSSQAQVTFKDAAKIGSVSATPTNPPQISAGNSQQYTVTVNRATGSGTNGAFTATITASGLPSGAIQNSLQISLANADDTKSGTLTITTTNATPGGTYPLTITATNPAVSGDSQTTSVNLNVKNNATSLIVSAASGTYGGTTSLSATLTSNGSGVPGKTISFSLNGGTAITASTDASGVATLGNVSLSGINAGSYPGGVSASFAGDASYQASSGTASLTVNKANAAISVTPYHVTYDGNAHTATGTATGVGGADLSASLTLTSTTHTGAGDYPSDGWSFAGGTNYNDASGTVHDIIDKANASISVTPYHVTYDGNAHTATGTATGVESAPADLSSLLHLGGTTHTNAGDYPSDAWTFDGNTNYNATSGTVHDIIDKANASISVTPYNVTYDGNAHTATGTATGVESTPADLSSLLHLGGTTHTNAGDYPSDAWTFDGNTNYNATSGTVHNSIAKANAHVTVTPYNVTYDGNAHTATGTATGVESTPADLSSLLHLGGTTHTNAGDYPSDAWTFDGNTNYNATSGTVHDSIAKANAHVTVTPYNVTYDGNAHTASGTALGVESSPADLSSLLHLGGTTHTNAGDYPADAWTFDGNGNYNATSGSVHDSVAKANANITITPYNVTYDGNAHTATGTALGVESTPADLSSLLHLGGTTHTNAGDYPADAWTFDGNANYNATSGSVHDNIAKADANITVTPYNVTYDGNAHTATGTATGVESTPADLSSLLHLGGTTHTDAGDYMTDAWTFDGNTNYNATSGTVHDSIAKANAHITVTPYTVTYDGNAHTATGTATGVESSPADLSSLLHLGSTTHTIAGDYPSDGWTFDGNGNYNATSGTVHDSIAKANAHITVTQYNVTYDGNAHTATGTATGVESPPADLSSLLHLGSTTHTDAGDYPSDAWTFDGNTNYNPASGTVHDIIDKANATINVTPYHLTYDGNPHTATGTATGVGGVDLSAGLNLSGTTHTDAGDYSADSWTFTSPNANYNNSSGTVHDVIDKANASIVVTPYNLTYDGNPHTATGSATGVKGENFNVYLTLTGTTHTDAGDYLSDPWVFTAPNGNYNGGSGTVHDVIAKASSNSVVTCPASVIYTGSTLTPCSASVSGAGGLSQSLTVSYLNNLNPGTATASASYPGDSNHTGSSDSKTFGITYGTCSASIGPGSVILPPINSNGTSVYNRKGGSTIPVKFRVCAANGSSISNPAAVFAGTGGALTMLSAVRGTITDINESTGTDIPDVAFRWDSSSQQWIFNMATNNLTSGSTYAFRINLASGTITFVVGVK